MPGSVRDYAILWVGAGPAGGGNAALGGNALLRVPQHHIDGIEHLEGDADSTHLDATSDHHGLLPTLSGDVADVFRGDGTFGDVIGGGMVPTFIAAGETFVVPENRQALFSMAIDNEGILEVDGFLVEVS